ncbi:ATP-binding cassette domain-containing protein [Streptomyces sp. QL37]|uniref:ATP-binding cassette domain-containing protein n=1 Tax=Streptomyces sp. QL37 TaxID=2093747 RepID=UPI000CF2FC6A|nr:ATP-binding cassette domain-containing protein [Streptomyces sp. QL37]PPQ56771.1 ABC transporter ATP-binding protein [Streptomyces sp. QL37]
MILRGVGRRYGLRGPWVLRGLDLELPARTLVRIEGPNGVGKSTLLRLLAGVDAPTEGHVTGRPRAAYVPERFPAALPFTAAGYLVHMGRVHGLPTAEAAARAQEWLARFGAAGHARTPLAELSKGTSQKVAVAQALLAEPDLLVLDEAWTGLDTAARHELDLAVAERVAEGATVVFVDHDPRRLAGAADLAYRLEGRTLTPAAVDSPGDAGPRVRIEATGRPPAALPPGLPGAPVVERDAGNPAAVRLTTTAAHSDTLLQALLTARPPWHVTGLSQLPVPAPVPAATDGAAVGQVPRPAPGAPSAAPAASVPETVSRPARAVRPPVGATAAVIRYQAATLARSQRWLAPLLLYAAVLGIGVQAGQPLLDSLGFAAAALLPAAAWFTRLSVTQEPLAARTVTASAVGPSRAHRASLLTGLGCALALGAAGTGIVLLVSAPVGTDHTVAVPLLPAALAGLLAAGCSALLGAAVGALCARPVLHRHGWSLAATVLGALLALVTQGSPARAAVTGLVSGSLTGTVRVPLLPLAGALAVAAVVGAVTSRIAALRE